MNMWCEHQSKMLTKWSSSKRIWRLKGTFGFCQGCLTYSKHVPFLQGTLFTTTYNLSALHSLSMSIQSFKHTLKHNFLSQEDFRNYYKGVNQTRVLQTPTIEEIIHLGCLLRISKALEVEHNIQSFLLKPFKCDFSASACFVSKISDVKKLRA